ncbi:ABC-type nitrate/sulfonate/bicarbonate transport system, substrate-binding protein [Amycolatopsis pretoriensis]|uniref:ABC-type nitrate/sulfonate/bicarbonate transport system, substrate-binding protein n=1 Tax=Amycolatopsis pretoriensis TaxID=218821 RepID=A0A1H5R1C2_9PSEU|nr:ABC transporter substrate-binding protein [Amycolatopsis pretoriensis]SEF32192.1 ABC-type nitrate/sulfonate/bicarbonate transport system, substrate-binding protein [Amycolatopsis pretoriensis]
MRLAVPDLVSPSYFPAIAAIDLGLAREEGLDVELELLYPVTDAAEALRTGKIDFLAGAAHAPMHVFPDWHGAKLVTALSQNMYWFLVVRPDLEVDRGDVQALRGIRIGAAPGPDLGLRRLLAAAGVEAGQIEIGPVPATEGAGTSFGLAAAQALAEGLIDGFWANGMGAEIAVLDGTGKVVLDARRGNGPPGTEAYTFPALAVTDETIARNPDAVAAMTRAVVRAQQALKADPDRATDVGERLFPAREATLIAELVRRDAPFYDPRITAETAAALVAFGRDSGLLEEPVGYESVVSERFRDLWHA